MGAITLHIGDGTDSSHVIEIDQGLGASNPKIRYDATNDRFELSVDGSSYVSFSSGDGVVGSKKYYNNSGGEIAAGSLLYISDYNSGEGQVEMLKAIATESVSTTLYAEFVAQDTVANEASGTAIEWAILEDQDTSGLTVGRPIYLDTSAGDWTGTLPALDNRIQIVGKVINVDASTGRILLKPGSPLWNIQAEEI